jgi:dihydrolipoamide dehydrogenase
MRIPDIGDFADVPVIEIHVAPGDVVAAEDPLVTLESDKATMDIPAVAAGTVEEVLVRVGSRVSTGDLVLRMTETGTGTGTAPATHPVTHEDAVPAPVDRPGYGSAAGVYDRVEVTVPDLGDFADVPVTEVLVAPGDRVGPHSPVVTLESDKAVMEIPASQAGTVEEVAVRVGDRVSAGRILLFLRTEEAAAPAPTGAAPAAASVDAPVTPTEPGDVRADVLVLGAGPGGYTAAFRAADLGRSVVLVDRWPALGGVCLNVGCIPSKALLHAAKVIAETREMAEHGLAFGEPSIDVAKLRGWKDQVVGRLTGGLAGLAKQRKVTTIRGYGRFTSPNQVRVELTDGGTTTVDFEHAIIAAGSEPVRLPFIPHDDPRVMDSTGALDLVDVPRRLLVLGGGIIGLEMATVYHQLGAEVTVVELMDQIIPGADKDLVAPLSKRISRDYANVYLKTKVTAVEARPEGLVVTFEGGKAPATATFDRMLVAVGRRPSGPVIDADRAGVLVDERGFVPVDKQMRTNVPHIFAVGDVVGQPMLAHKATHEGKVAAEVTAGQSSFFDARVIPSVAYTDPEVAWVGVTENEAKAAGTAYGKGSFPWAASGRALSLGRDEGFTKLLFDEASHRVIGAGVVGPSAGELVAELGLAIEMGADAADIGLTIHAHPTLSETVGMAAEAFEGTLTDLYIPKRN